MLANPLEHLPPSQTTIDVEPKGFRVVRGSPVTIQAATAGALPQSLELITWQGTNAKGELIGQEKVAMENLGGGKFSSKIARLDKTLRYRVVTGAFTSATFTAEAVDTPEIANVQLMLYPPAYTGLGSISSPEGSIEGLKGSSVRLDAVTTKDVVKAEIVMDDGKKIPLKIDGRKLQANLVLFQSQSYRILVEDSHGFKNSPISYELRVKPDGFPTVDLLRPTEDLEINGDEILNLEYSARDDFGIAEVNLIAKIGDREDKIRLARDDAKRLILRDQYKWDLGQLGLRDEDDAVFFLQVFDNDTISGPKLGTSKSVRLKLKNLKGEHQQIAEMVKDLNARMIESVGRSFGNAHSRRKADAAVSRNPTAFRAEPRRRAQAHRRDHAAHGKGPHVRFRDLLRPSRRSSAISNSPKRNSCANKSKPLRRTISLKHATRYRPS